MPSSNYTLADWMAITMPRCAICNSTNPRHIYDGLTYCPQCYASVVQITCRVCGREVGPLEAVQEGVWYCGPCWHRLATWHSTPFPVSIATYKQIISKRKFGVEIETDDCPHFRQLFDSGWGCHYDGSISGMEFVSPILYGDEGLASIEKVCKFAANKGWSIDDDCGIHVHVDMRGESIEALKAVAYAYARTRRGWFRLVDPLREDGEYCESHEFTRRNLDWVHTFDDFCDLADENSRYAWINLASYAKYGTLEIRAHHASLDAKEIGNWVIANLLFVDYVKGMSFDEIDEFFGHTTAGSLTGMYQCWPEALSYYYTSRALARV